MDDSTTTQLDTTPPSGDRVVMVLDGAAIKVLPLPTRGVVNIGRSPRCDVTIDAPSVSRHHANLFSSADGVELEDVGSANGTHVDGTRLAAHQRVRIGLGITFLIGAVPVLVHVRPRPVSVSPATGALATVETAAAKVAATRLGILLVGETGTGKRVLAERLHARSGLAGSFVRINCAAVDDAALEAELPELLRQAVGGTAFLDNVTELAAPLQSRLVRVIEDGSLDVRFIAAATRVLDAEVASGAFRDDLYFRLCGAVFTVPPLRDRRAEILPLAEHFLATAAGKPMTLSPAARTYVTKHAWPGNVRELRNACERAVLLCGGGTIEVAHLGGDVRAPARPTPSPAPAMPSELRDAVAAIERERILEALESCAGNQKRAAELLGISRRTLSNRLDEYGIARPRKQNDD